ncbi:MAG: hypothetical protein H7X89_05435 [Rhizobiales bacterium]|nr:hypothetical protein [Hyphomicrobiales bacterium]
MRTEPIETVGDAVIFRFNERAEIEGDPRINGTVISAHELVAGTERQITRWEHGQIHVKGAPPFGIFATRNVEVGTSFKYHEVISRVLGISIDQFVPEAPHRNPLDEAQWALDRIDSDDSALRSLSRSVLRDSIRLLGSRNSEPLISRIIADVEEADKPGNSQRLHALFELPAIQRKSYANLYFEILLRNTDASDVAAKLLLDTDGIDLKPYSTDAELELRRITANQPQNGEPRSYYQNKSVRLSALVMLMFADGEAGRNRVMNAILELKGPALIGFIWAIKPGQQRFAKWDWRDTELRNLIALSDTLTVAELEGFYKNLRSRQFDRRFRNEMLEHARSRLAKTSDPGDRRILESLIEYISNR